MILGLRRPRLIVCRLGVCFCGGLRNWFCWVRSPVGWPGMTVALGPWLMVPGTLYYSTGWWWLEPWNFEWLSIQLGMENHPNWLTPWFFRGVGIPSTSQPVNQSTNLYYSRFGLHSQRLVSRGYQQKLTRHCNGHCVNLRFQTGPSILWVSQHLGCHQ